MKGYTTHMTRFSRSLGTNGMVYQCPGNVEQVSKMPSTLLSSKDPSFVQADIQIDVVGGRTFMDSAPPSIPAPSPRWHFSNSTELRLNPESSPQSGLPIQASFIQQADGLALSSDSSTDDDCIASAKSCDPRGIKRSRDLRSDSDSPDELALASKRTRKPFPGAASKRTRLPARRGRPPKSNPQPSQAAAFIISERKKNGQDDKMEYLIRPAPVWVGRGTRVTDTMLRQWDETKKLRRGSM